MAKVNAEMLVTVDSAEIDVAIEKTKELNALLERSTVLIDELSGSSKKVTDRTVTLKQIQQLREDVFEVLRVLHDDAFERRLGLVDRRYEAIMKFKDSNR